MTATEREEGVLDTEESDGEEVGVFSSFPDELILLIFQHLGNRDLVSSVVNVCKKWNQLSSDPSLWKSRFIFYNFHALETFVKAVRKANTQIGFLHLGGHEAMEEVAMEALLSSDITCVKSLSFLSSCRTAPKTVLAILEKFCSSIESLTLCLNDELVSYGIDGHSCYAISDSELRPGILFRLLGQMKILRNLTLFGGFISKWYFDELHESSGCSQIESLDIKDFCELPFKISGKRKQNFLSTLILKNKSHLKSIKLSTMCAADEEIKRCVCKCNKTLKELLVDVHEMEGITNNLTGLHQLHLRGRFLTDLENQSVGSVFRNCMSVLDGLQEVSLVQFSQLSNENLSCIIGSCYNLKILRVEGNILSLVEIIHTIANVSLSLETLCIRNSDLIAEKHFISMDLYTPLCKCIDLDEIYDMNCFQSALKLQNVPHRKLKVIQTGCDCQLALSGDSHCVQWQAEEQPNASFGNAQPNHFESTTQHGNADGCASYLQFRVVHLSMSNNLDEAFVFSFQDLKREDVVFHFNQ